MNSFVRVALSAILASSAMFVLSCAKSGEIQLVGTNPNLPTGDGNSQRDPDGSGDNKGDTGDGSGSDQRPPEPDIPQGPEKRFALLCEYKPLNSLQMVESDDFSIKLGKFPRLVESKEPSDQLGDVKNEIYGVRLPLGTGAIGPGRFHALLIGRKGSITSAGPERLYRADISSAYRVGSVQSLGSPVNAGPQATARAAAFGFSLRTYGFSDDGQAIIRPAGEGYVIEDPMTLKDLGRIDWTPSRHTNPILLQKQGVMIAQTYDGSRFALRAARFTQTKSGLFNFSALKVPAAGEGFSQTAAISWDDHTIAWLESKINSAGGASSSGARIAFWNVQTNTVRRSALGLPKSGTLNGQIGHWRKNGKDYAVVMFEQFKSANKVERAEAIAFDISGDAAVMAMRAKYAEDGIKQMESVGHTGRTQSQGVFSGPDGRTVMVIAPSLYPSQVYRMGGEYLSAATVAPCIHAAITPELL